MNINLKAGLITLGIICLSTFLLYSAVTDYTPGIYLFFTLLAGAVVFGIFSIVKLDLECSNLNKKDKT